MPEFQQRVLILLDALPVPQLRPKRVGIGSVKCIVPADEVGDEWSEAAAEIQYGAKKVEGKSFASGEICHLAVILISDGLIL